MSQDTLEEVKALLELTNRRQISSTLREWLGAPDASVDHNAACGKKHPGTGTWLLDSPQFSRWLAQKNSTLWLKGLTGLGKSVLCSTAVQLAFRYRRGDHRIGIAYFYFTFREESKQNESSMIRALLWQLSSQIRDRPTDLIQMHELYSASTPPSTVLLLYLRRLIRRFDRTYIFLGALDESPIEQRENMLGALEEMDKWDVQDLHLFLTSRDHGDIRRSLDCFADHQIEMRNAGIDRDIADLISRRLNQDRNLFKLSRYHDQIRAALTENAKGV